LCCSPGDKPEFYDLKQTGEYCLRDLQFTKTAAGCSALLRRIAAFLAWSLGGRGLSFLDLTRYDIDRQYNDLIVAGNAVVLPVQQKYTRNKEDRQANWYNKPEASQKSCSAAASSTISLEV
jgi:hypothetical protein